MRIDRAQEEPDPAEVELAPEDEFVLDFGNERVFQRQQRSVRGDLVDFAIELRRRGPNGYVPVIRVDTSHEVVHRHLFDPSGKEVDRVEMPHLDYEAGFIWALEEVYGRAETNKGVPR